MPLPPALDIEFEHSPLDARGALCPNCGHYLNRARIGVKDPFFVERCSHCGGIWCDHGEWEVLEKLGLSATVPLLFLGSWQSQLRELEAQEHEHHMLMEKLGNDLAGRVLRLGEELKAHPHGDIALAHLMRVVNR
jgi:Zn-finger nucleic acid-binding protein